VYALEAVLVNYGVLTAPCQLRPLVAVDAETSSTHKSGELYPVRTPRPSLDVAVPEV
jgi:hypothetical protein